MIEIKHKRNCAVILASHNGEAYLSQQLSSIKEQTGVNTNIYYSDDESSDGSKEILNTFRCINLNHSADRFGSAAANFLNAIRKYEPPDNEQYIFFSDQDDIWLPNKMQAAICALEKNGCDAYSGSFYAWNVNKKTVKYVNKKFSQNKIDHLFRSPGPGFTFCLTRNAFAEIKEVINQNQNKFQNIRWHDWLIYSIARNRGLNWFIDCEPYALYRLHDQNDTGQMTSINEMMVRLKFVLSGKFGEQVRLLVDDKQSNRIWTALQRMTIRDRIYLICKIPLMRTKTADRIALLLWVIFERKSNVN
jgi:rhamnosyltransferase